MTVYAFIFARGGSKEIKNKNIKLFKGKPLISYSINIAKYSNEIEQVFVSTDSKKIIKVSKNYGAKIIKRPTSLSRDDSLEIDAWKHAVKYIHSKGLRPKFFVSLPCTAPLRIKKDISSALKKIKSNTDLVVGLTDSVKSPYYNIVELKSNKKIKPVISKNFYINRQKVKKTYDMTTIIYACRFDLISKLKKSIWEANIKYIKIPINRAIDIDNKLDFKIAEYLYKY